MWPGRYWGKRYWPFRYWPIGNGTPAPPGPPVVTVVSHGWIPPAKRALDFTDLMDEMERLQRKRRLRRDEEELVVMQ